MCIRDRRKTVKKLRYTADFFAPLFADDGQSAALRDHAKLTEALQDRLGALNDIATAPQLLRSLSLDAVPVSYTHLDVYKRQVLDPGLRRGTQSG